MQATSFAAFVKPGRPFAGTEISHSVEARPGYQRVTSWTEDGPGAWGETRWFDDETQARDARGVLLYASEDGDEFPADDIVLVEIGADGRIVPGGVVRPLCKTPPSWPTSLTLTERQIATVLASLRLWQRLGANLTSALLEADIATNAGAFKALDSAEVAGVITIITGEEA